jgi:CIC family chloride channel protein
MLKKSTLGSIYIMAVLIFIFPTLLRVMNIKVLSENNPGKILENTLLAISK